MIKKLGKNGEMKNNFFQFRQNVIKAIIAIASVLAVSLIVIAICLFGMKDVRNGADGKDGIDGKNATVIISDDGELIVNDNHTGVGVNREDCEIVLNAEGEEFGKVIGGGKFTAGKTVAVQAVPFTGACFKGWKNSDGEIVSLDEIYVFVAQKGKVEFVAVFEKSLIEVYFKTYETGANFGGDFQLLINGENRELKDERDKYGRLYCELNSPAVFGYGDRVTLKIPNFSGTSYKAYIKEISESEYKGESSSSGNPNDITDEFEYTFTINENKKYYFSFYLEFSISIEIIPHVEVVSSDPSFGTVANTDCTGKGDEVTVTATVKESGTSDYIYAFAGWYLNGELVSENEVYTFTATDDAGYDFTAKFIKKYALKISVSIYDKEVIAGQKVSEDAYKVKYKKITVVSTDKSGVINSVTFNGNNDGVAETAVKICGYFEVGEKIFLSYDIESAHDSYYEISDSGEKYYKEKFVYGTWQVICDGEDSVTNFSQGASGAYFINEEDALITRINVSLQVVLNGDKIRG